MSIEREHGEHVLYCDICDEEVRLDTFGNAVDYKKENGWQSKKDSKGNWSDFCPDCQ